MVKSEGGFNIGERNLDESVKFGPSLLMSVYFNPKLKGDVTRRRLVNEELRETLRRTIDGFGFSEEQETELKERAGKIDDFDSLLKFLRLEVAGEIKAKLSAYLEEAEEEEAEEEEEEGEEE